MTLFAMMPFRDDRNLGAAYNESMRVLPDGAWAAFFDHDMFLTTPHWHRQISEAIACRPDAGAFTAVTNRIASPWQRAEEVDPNNDSVAYHRQIGAARVARRTLLDITGTKGFGGVVFVISRRAWVEIGGFADGMYCVDHVAHFALVDSGRRNYLIDGLYVYHVRASSSARPPLPAATAKGCRCRGREEMPTERIALP